MHCCPTQTLADWFLKCITASSHLTKKTCACATAGRPWLWCAVPRMLSNEWWNIVGQRSVSGQPSYEHVAEDYGFKLRNDASQINSISYSAKPSPGPSFPLQEAVFSSGGMFYWRLNPPFTIRQFCNYYCNTGFACSVWGCSLNDQLNTLLWVLWMNQGNSHQYLLNVLATIMQASLLPSLINTLPMWSSVLIDLMLVFCNFVFIVCSFVYCLATLLFTM